ncbi:glycosyl hydrolase [Ancylomarina euxinus]|uniref:Endo-1,3-beta-glucanase btgC n=1 Tax=Ancylomarina euxinus TaxID=2283627 RepID=A0A425Y4A2_9BACT|nr:glycosyl hydrolase family 17 protein [Ancylomarina euxinus]MCZ4694629.1 glycosyl hydrolase family 17 protein [Ancylomarina euxinus]MUP14172.1 glycosyl hydrolase [Ancylomarina euxinus]RRG23027.1 glycosyl hydrolase [Ancylomarina euxinus]
MISDQRINRKIANLALLIFFSFSLICCKQTSKSKQAITNEAEPEMKAIKQSKDDLLNGVSRAVCYSGFRTGQHPDRGEGAINPSDEQVLEDLKIISRDSLFNLIRLYDSGENSEAVLRIIKENKLDIKVMLGIWLKAELSAHETCGWLTEPIAQEVLDKNSIANQEEIQKGIQLANQYPDIVVAVNVGNESLVEWNDHKVDTDSIIVYVQKVQKAIKQPVTVADNYEWWAAKGSQLAKAVDFISIHVYPVWEGKDIDEAMAYTIENVQKVRNALPNSKIVITEAGWATVASEFGERASEDKQARYYEELMKWTKEMNITTFFFEAFDEDWKGETANPLGAEKHWGMFSVDRKPKKLMQKMFSH